MLSVEFCDSNCGSTGDVHDNPVPAAAAAIHTKIIVIFLFKKSHSPLRNRTFYNETRLILTNHSSKILSRFCYSRRLKRVVEHWISCLIFISVIHRLKNRFTQYLIICLKKKKTGKLCKKNRYSRIKWEIGSSELKQKYIQLLQSSWLPRSSLQQWKMFCCHTLLSIGVGWVLSGVI